MKKILLAALALVLVGLGVAYARLGVLVKRAVETYGSRAVGAPVRVGSIIVSPFSGKARVRGLSVGNPPGFKSPTAFLLRDVRVELDMASLRGSGPVVVRSVIVEGVEVTYETGSAGSNVARIQKNVDAYAPAAPKEKSASGRPVKIVLFKATGAKTRLVVPELGQDREVALPDLELRDLGGGSGATVKQVSAQLLAALGSSAMRAGGVGGLLDEAKKALPGALRDLFK